MDNIHEPIADSLDRIPSSISTDDLSAQSNLSDDSSIPQEFQSKQSTEETSNTNYTLRKRNVKRTTSATSLDGNGTDEEKDAEKEEHVVTDEDESLTDEELNSSLTDEDNEESLNAEGSSTAPPQPSPPKKRVDSIKSERKEKDASEKKLMGVTDEGETFVLPKTKNPLTMYAPTKWNFFDWVQNSAMFNLLWLLLPLPTWFYVFLFVFWRLGYNLGIGYILHKQSKTKFLTKYFSVIRASPYAPIVGKVLSVGMGPDYDFEKLPTAFNAWLGFRRVVDIVLAQDLISYLVLCLACWQIPETITIPIILSYMLGVALCFFALWAKADSYRVVKDFAWYWGDFFFLVDQKLTFDRVFSISPHPMYTLGYTFFYGASLITQSNTVLLASLFGHFCQLAFLQFVENPHIEKTYPGTVENPNAKEKEILYDYFRRDLIVFRNLDVFRSSDLFLVIILFYCLFLNMLNLHPIFYIVQAIFWRGIHSGGLGYILHQQSKRKLWTNHFLKLGYSKQYAFENWKRIYNMSLVMTHVVFFCGALKFAIFDFETYGFWVVLRIVVGLMLIGLNLYSSVSTFEVLGEFGWFYGDFFIDELPSKIYYSGIYRYLNNPDNVTGFAAYYGAALLSGSWIVFALALISQLSSITFHQRVERPHMKRLYGNEMRKKSGIEEALTQMFKEAIEKNPKLKELSESAERLNSKAKSEAEKMIQRWRKLRKSLRDSAATLQRQ